MKQDKEEVLGAVARGWCSKKNEKKIMDIDLAEAIAEEVMKLPLFDELNIEKEMEKLYVNCVDERLKLDLLMTIDHLRAKLTEMKEKQDEV